VEPDANKVQHFVKQLRYI